MWLDNVNCKGWLLDITDLDKVDILNCCFPDTNMRGTFTAQSEEIENAWKYLWPFITENISFVERMERAKELTSIYG